MKVKTERTFDAAHKLENDEGDCGQLHGHRWKVIVWAEGDLEGDILFDFRKLKEIVEPLDHSHLNEVLDFNPTAENIAEKIRLDLKYEFPKLDFKVQVHESPKSYAEVGQFEGE